MKSGQAEYDRGIDVFSPDGRLFQVEYAREAVKRGTTSVGIVGSDGVVLIVDKRIATRLVIPSSVEKMFLIDHHIGCSISGLIADARYIVDFARTTAQVHRITYDEPMDIGSLVKRISDLKQYFTQMGGLRPFGTSLLIAGKDDYGFHLYETDPSGSFVKYNAGGIGSGHSQVHEFFEKEYAEGLNIAQSLDLGMRAMSTASESGLESATLEAGYVGGDGNFTFFDRNAIAGAVEKCAKR